MHLLEGKKKSQYLKKSNFNNFKIIYYPSPTPKGMDDSHLIHTRLSDFLQHVFSPLCLSTHLKDKHPGVCQGIEGYGRKLTDLVLAPVLQLTAEYLPVDEALFLCLLL